MIMNKTCLWWLIASILFQAFPSIAQLTLLNNPIAINLSPFMDGTSSNVYLKGCQITIQGVGYFLMNVVDSTGSSTRTWYQYIGSPSQPTTIPCPAFSSVAASTVTVVSLSSPLILSSFELIARDSSVTLLNVNQSMPYYGYFPDPSAVATVYGITQPSLPLTTYQITAMSNINGQTSQVSSGVIGSSLWNVTFGNLSSNINYTFSVRSSSQLPGLFPILLISQHTLTTPISFLCPPGYYANVSAASSTNCLPCPLSTASPDWGSSCIACQSGFTPLIGYPYCASSLAHWSFDTDSRFNETLSFYGTALSGGSLNTLSITTNQRVFGDGSLYSDGSSAQGLAVDFFYWFCYYSEDCWIDARNQNSWSFTFWFQPTSLGSLEHTIIASGSPNNGRRYHAYFTGSPAFFTFDAYTSNAVRFAHIQSDIGVVSVNQWVHIAVTWNQVNGILNLYVNGTLSKTSSFSTSALMRPPNENTTHIGYVEGDSEATFTGYIDELWFFSGDLNNERVILVMCNNTDLLVQNDAFANARNSLQMSAHPFNLSSLDDDPPPPLWYIVPTKQKIKNQETCGWCIAYSQATAFEYFYQSFGRPVVNTSPLQIAECSKYGPCTPDGKGYNLSALTEWIIQAASNGTICKDDAYHSLPNHVCSFCFQENTLPKVNTKYFYAPLAAGPPNVPMSSSIAQYNDQALRQMIVKNGPVAIAYFANNPWFKRFGLNGDTRKYLVQQKTEYVNSMKVSRACKQAESDHWSVIIGWTDDYWIVQNSWGTHWGKQGLGFFERKDEQGHYVNFCGMYSWPVFFYGNITL